MNLHMPEDAASLLEQFVHDVANAPAEITHLLEEIQAKDRLILTYKDEISKRDAAIQKWVRLNGGHVLNPKEEAYSKTIKDCLDKCDVLQAEKCGLGEKALIVLERQIRRLDVGLRSLSVREEFPSDWSGPSMISGSATGVSTPASGGVGGVSAASGPLQSISGNISATAPGGGPSIANAAQLRMAQSSAHHRTPTIQTPATAPRSTREPSSEASTSNKRRRPNASLGALPTAASHLRQSSLGPGTPKAGTPNPATASSRQSSAQPTRPAAASSQKKVPAASTSTRKPPPTSTASSRKRARPSSTKKLDRRRALQTASARNTASPTPSSDRSSASPSPTAALKGDGAGSEGEAEEEGDDTTLYCFCQKVSFGDMVGCDNDECKYQWFHWGCVGLRSEPMGEWLCPECRGEVKG